MRIILVTNGLRFGGAERIVEALAIALRDSGDAVHVVATTRDGPIGERLRSRNIPVSVLHIKSAYDGRVPLKLARVATKFNADLIHSHLAVADIATAMSAPLIPNVRIITTVHNPGIEHGLLKSAMWRMALGRFHKIMAVSEPVAQALPSHLTATIVRPSLVSENNELPSQESVRKGLGIPPDARVIIAIGRLVRVKGFDVLARAADLLTTSNVRLIIIGDGPEREQLKHPRLELLGSREDAAELLTAADIVVNTSRSEGFPQVILQAMAAAKPVVATRVGGTPEIVSEETGILVPPEDPQAVAGALDDLLRDPERAQRLGARGRERLLQEGFTREAMIERIRSAYDAVLQR